MTVRLPAILIQQIEDWALEHDVTRSDAIRGALEALVALGGLDPEPEAPVMKPARAPKAKTSAATQKSVSVSVPLAGTFERKIYQKGSKK